MTICLRTIVILCIILKCTCARLEELICEPARVNELGKYNELNELKVGRQGDIVEEVPSKTDLVLYLNSVLKVIRYGNENKMLLNLNFAFGLVLINVNLKSEMKYRNSHIESSMLERVREIVNENDELIKHFMEKVRTNTTLLNKLDKLLLTLFINETMWVERMVQFDGTQFPEVVHHSLERLEELYGSWDSYLESLNGEDQTDDNRCLMALALNSVVLLVADPICELSDYCHDYLRNGSNVGYALGYRILLLLTARHGRGCIVFSKEEDQALMEEFCNHAYTEAEYIAMNDYVAMDVLMEFVSFCAMSGRVDFLQRSWVNFVLLHQLPVGCFSLDAELVKTHVQMAVMTNHREVSDEHCNLQLTAEAGVALATAARYVIASTRSQEPEVANEYDIDYYAVEDSEG